MLSWIKMETNLLADERILRLIDEMGPKGLGVYTMVRIECDAREGCTMAELFRLCGEYTGRKIISRVVTDYDLFCYDPSRSPLVRSRAGQRAPVRAAVRAEPRAEAKSDNPTDTEEEKEIRDIRERLLSPTNMMWRESMMMQSGYSALLLQHWPEAVEFFIRHLMAQDKVADMRTEHDLRQYFTNFSRGSLPSGQRLQAYLATLADPSAAETRPDGASIAQDGILYFNGRPLPPDAPPRPSPTAEWDDASCSWLELYR